MSERFATLRAIEQRFITKIAAHRDNKPDHELDAQDQEGKPVVVDGKLVRLRMYSAPPAIDLRGLDALVSVESVWEAGLEKVTLGEHPHLEELDLSREEIPTLDVSGCPVLRRLDVAEGKLTAIRGLPPTLVELTCHDNPLGRLDVRHLTALEVLGAMGCELSELDVTPLVRLRELSVGNNELTELDASTLTGLVTLHVGGNPGLRVRYPAASGLTGVWARGTAVAEFDAERYPALEYLALGETGLRTVRLANPVLRTLAATRRRVPQRSG